MSKFDGENEDNFSGGRHKENKDKGNEKKEINMLNIEIPPHQAEK